jgi:hypothetical protein
VVWARSLEHLLEVVRGAFGRRLLALVLSSGHERVIGSWLILLLLLLRAVRGSFAGVLVPLGLATGAVSDHLLARGVAGSNVKEILGGPRTFSPQLVN